MKRYQINDAELTYLKEMIEYLSVEGNSLSEHGSERCKEVFGAISSRPVIDMVIDNDAIQKALEEGQLEEQNINTKEISND